VSINARGAMTTRPGLRYALLFAVAAVPLLEIGTLKPAPRVLVVALFVTHALLSAGTRRADGSDRSSRSDRSGRSWARDSLTALLWTGCFVASGIYLCTSLALWAWPPVTADGHPVMAIGQAFIGIVAGGIAGIVVAVRGSLWTSSAIAVASGWCSTPSGRC
jgi:hypothetical protein